MFEIKAATETGLYERQVSAMMEKQQHILSVLSKKTYSIDCNGKCFEADQKLPLYEEFIYYPDNNKLLQHDSDLYAFKPLTDVVIKGYATHKHPTARFVAGVQVGRHSTEILVQGNRKAFLNAENKIQFTGAELIQQVPLRYDYAYGGCDTEAEKKIILPDPEVIKLLPAGFDLFAKSLFRYQRNLAGKGYIVQNNRTSFDNLELPNLEDPLDLLTPENLLVGDENRWHEMPLPRCTDWADILFYPRLDYFGIAKIFEKKPYQLKETIRKWADKSLLSETKPPDSFNHRCCNGASLGLQLPYVARGEQVKLTNMHPKHADFKFELPAEYPRIWIDGRKGKLLETKPVIQTVVIEPDENRLSLVWRGTGPALRPYHGEELKSMPFKVEWNSK